MSTQVITVRLTFKRSAGEVHQVSDDDLALLIKVAIDQFLQHNGGRISPITVGVEVL